MFKLHSFEFVVYFAAWFSEVAIYTLLLELDTPPSVISLVVAMNFLPAILISPISGVIIDFINPKKLLLVLALIQVVSTFFMIYIDSYSLVWLLGLLLFIKMASASMHFQTDMTVTAKLVRKDSLHIANEIQAMLWSFCYSAGMAISGFFVARFGVDAAFVVDIIIILLALPLLLFIDFPKVEALKHSPFFMLKDGVRYVLKNRDIGIMIVLHSIVGLMIIAVLLTLLADIEYKAFIAVAISIGLMNSFKAVGLMIGAPIFGRFVNEHNFHIPYLVIGVLFIIWSLFFMESFYLTLFFLFIIGCVGAVIWAYSYTILQKRVQREYLGRVLAYNDMGFMGVGVITTYFIGYAYEAGLSLGGIGVVIGLCFSLGAFLYIRYKEEIVGNL
jgi:MFS family permease